MRYENTIRKDKFELMQPIKCKVKLYSVLNAKFKKL